MATLDDARRLVSSLPGAIEGGDRFGFGVEVKGKARGFVWSWMERVHPKKPKVENRDVLAIRTPGLGAKEVLTLSLVDKLVDDLHYNGYPAILVRLAAIDPDELRDLVLEAWRVTAPKDLLKAYDAERA